MIVWKGPHQQKWDCQTWRFWRAISHNKQKSELLAAAHHSQKTPWGQSTLFLVTAMVFMLQNSILVTEHFSLCASNMSRFRKLQNNVKSTWSSLTNACAIWKGFRLHHYWERNQSIIKERILLLTLHSVWCIINSPFWASKEISSLSFSTCVAPINWVHGKGTGMRTG